MKVWHIKQRTEWNVWGPQPVNEFMIHIGETSGTHHARFLRVHGRVGSLSAVSFAPMYNGRSVAENYGDTLGRRGAP